MKPATFKILLQRMAFRPRGRQDYRLLALFSLVLAIVALGYFVRFLPSRGIEAVPAPVKSGQSGFAGLGPMGPESPVAIPEEGEDLLSNVQSKELASALKQSESLIGAGKYDDAIRALNQVQPLAANSALAYRQLGRALLGKKDYATARDFLAKAIDLDPTLAEAYFDHAAASEGLGDLEGALGGMRSFLHLVKNADPYRLPVAQARSAIWEWEAKLGRGPWGPTKGIPPGFTAEQLKRDGKGTGVMMQKPETLRPDGTMDYEIKAGKRFPELWKK